MTDPLLLVQKEPLVIVSGLVTPTHVLDDTGATVLEGWTPVTLTPGATLTLDLSTTRSPV